MNPNVAAEAPRDHHAFIKRQQPTKAMLPVGYTTDLLCHNPISICSDLHQQLGSRKKLFMSDIAAVRAIVQRRGTK
jgi:hypothetical protein